MRIRHFAVGEDARHSPGPVGGIDHQSFPRVADLFEIVVGQDGLAVLQGRAEDKDGFYTFQSISYSVEVFKGRARPASDFITFAAYLGTGFPP